MVRAIAITYWAWAMVATVATVVLAIYRYDGEYVTNFFSQPDAMAVSAVLVILLANLLIVNTDSVRKV
jgi:hypothetical protein